MKITILFGLLEAGLEKQIPDKKDIVNQSIVVSWKNSLRLGIPFGIIIGIVLWLALVITSYTAITISSFLVLLFVGLFMGFTWFGGDAVIEHYTLRLTTYPIFRRLHSV